MNEYGDLREAVEESIKNACGNGTLNEKQHAATIAMLRHMADEIDNNDGETQILRYITPASFLSYCEKLGFTPDLAESKSNHRIDKNSKLHIVGSSKWKRA